MSSGREEQPGDMDISSDRARRQPALMDQIQPELLQNTISRRHRDRRLGRWRDPNASQVGQPRRDAFSESHSL